MPKVYFYTDAEFQVGSSSGNAISRAARLNAGDDYIDLTLFRQSHPLSLTGFDISQNNVVDGQLTATALADNLLLIRMRGIFHLTPKSAYVSLVLDSEVLWQIATSKAICGVKRVDYEDYYGMKSVMSLQIVAAKSLKDLRSSLGSSGLDIEGLTKSKAKKPTAQVTKTSSSFKVSGNFSYVQCAEVLPNIVQKVILGNLAGGELEEVIQTSAYYFSLYGADKNDLKVELDGVFIYQSNTVSVSNWITEASTRVTPPTATYLEESFDLSLLPKSKYYVFTIDYFHGSEEYSFKGPFLTENFSADRIKLIANLDMILSEVVRIAYKDASIIENISKTHQQIFVMQKGILKNISS